MKRSEINPASAIARAPTPEAAARFFLALGYRWTGKGWLESPDGKVRLRREHLEALHEKTASIRLRLGDAGWKEVARCAASGSSSERPRPKRPDGARKPRG